MERHEKIKALRKQAGLSIHQAATICRVNDRTWGRWEAGDRRMPAGALDLFCTRIGVGYEAEFGGD